MKKQIDYNFRENVEDALRLAELMYLMYTLPQPSIARINGSTIGGGTGLAAVNDIVIACDRAQFSLSEVKLGLVPACISPYVVRRMGEKNCREYFLTGERLSAGKAMASGLVNYVVSEGELDLVVNQRIEQLLTSGPVALAACKKMIRDVRDMDLQDAKVYTAELLAKLRIGGEGQEGMRAFFEKRKPEWVKVL
jgi:methylglutaconyl-CoA hydratase